MWARILFRNAGVGAGLGAAQGASDTQDLTGPDAFANTLRGAGWGGLLGGAAPAVGAAIGAGYRAAAPSMNAAPEGLSRVSSGLLQNALPADATQTIAGLGPDAMLLDASPRALGLAQGVAAKGEGQDALVNALMNRQAGQSGRLMSDLSQLGPAISPEQFALDMRARQQAAGPLFQRALQNAGPVDTSAVLDQMSRDVPTAGPNEAQALGQARQWLTEPAPAPPPPAPEIAPGWENPLGGGEPSTEASAAREQAL